MVPASELRASPSNWRRHPAFQRGVLQDVLAEVGFAGAVLARETPEGLEIIDGHLRAEVGGKTEIPVLILDVDEAEAKKLLATFDPIGALAVADNDALIELLGDVKFDSKAITDELHLLYLSIKMDGYTQPVVTIFDAERGKYIIVDGFHRYLVMKYHADIREPRGGLLPVVVLDKPLNDRMASTIRHNRARGKHNINGMAGVVFKMLDGGWTDSQICAEIGLETDELIRLKYVTGFAKLFEDVEYSKSWETRRMIKLKRDYLAKAEQ